jgi:hypothetical protein
MQCIPALFDFVRDEASRGWMKDVRGAGTKMTIFHFEIDTIDGNSLARENRSNDRYFPAEHELGGDADPAEHCGGIRCRHWLAVLLGSTTAVHFELPQVRKAHYGP